MDGDERPRNLEAESIEPLEIDLSLFQRVYDQYRSKALAKTVEESRSDFPEIDLALLP